MPKNPRRRNQFGVQVDGPVVIPKLYDGHNKTFFMGAYEGVRAEGCRADVRLGADGADAAGQLLRGHHADQEPADRTAVRRKHHPAVACCRQSRRSCSQYYPAAEPAGHRATTFRARGRTGTTTDQFLARVDQNVGNKVRLSVRYNWHDRLQQRHRRDSRRRAITQPRVNKNTLVSYTHTLTPNLLQRLPHRLSPHRLRHAESLLGERQTDCRRGRWAFRASTATSGTTIPVSRASTSATSAGWAAGGTNWYQFDTTFQMSNVLAYTRGSHNVRTGFDLRRMATGRRAANDPRGPVRFHRRHDAATRWPTSCSACRER